MWWAWITSSKSRRSNSERAAGWRVAPAWIDGHEVLAVLPDAQQGRERYFVEEDFADGKVSSIRDFRYVHYIAQEGLRVSGNHS